MKVRMKKLWFTIPLLLMLGAIVYYGYMQRHPASTEMLSFRIGTGNSAETISAWYDGEGTYYVFLPSYADIRRVNKLMYGAAILGEVICTAIMCVIAFV